MYEEPALDSKRFPHGRSQGFPRERVEDREKLAGVN
jgi:hypothetical protein